MSRSELGARNGLICSECGAFNLPEAQECWICHSTGLKAQDQVGDKIQYPQGFFSTIPGWMILIAGISLALGLYRMAPGILMAALIFVLPPVLIVEFWAARRRDAWQPMSMAQRIGLFILLLFLLPIVVFGSLFIALLAICSLNGPPSFH
jgi:ribosomal protein L40E